MLTDGTSQGLFIVVAIVIFGIFVALSYTVFGSDGLSEGLSNIFDTALTQSETNLNRENYILARDSDFQFRPTGAAPDGIGYYQYTGRHDYVILPDTINGEPITHAYRMFEDTTVKGVKGSVSTLTNMRKMFWGSNAEELVLNELDTSQVSNMRSMFRQSKALYIDISGFDTGNVETMRNMFRESSALEVNISSLDTSQVTDMHAMFTNSELESLDLSSFDTSNVLNMQSMFGHTKMEHLDLSGFDTSNVFNMTMMFNHASLTEIDLSSFDLSSVEHTERMLRRLPATVGYARTQEDADILNASDYKPDELTFIVK